MRKIPVIDIGGFLAGRPEPGSLQALDAACRDHGFFLLTGHGMDALIDAVWQQAHGFFGSSNAVKRSVERSRDNALGYFNRELTKQKRDQKEVFDYADDAQETSGTGFGRSQWPRDLPAFRDTLIAYPRACAVLTNHILAMLYTALDSRAPTCRSRLGPSTLASCDSIIIRSTIRWHAKIARS